MTENTTLFDLPAPEPSADLGKGELWIGDAKRVLNSFEDQAFQTCATSPPYWGLRDYGIEGQVGAEQSVDDYVEHLVTIFREVKRTLRDDGTFWLNIGDSYTSGGRTWRQTDKKLPARGMSYRPPTPEGLKPKDLVGVPWRVASALQRDGWYLRSEIIWHKPNSLPESVKDRPSRAHEFLFLLSKSERYHYDHEATKQPALNGDGRVALRDVWSINTEPFPDAHFATYPKALVRPCILAGSKPGSRVLDPFLGSGTTGEVCAREGRDFVGIELNRDYAEIAARRLEAVGAGVMQLVQPEGRSNGRERDSGS